MRKEALALFILHDVVSGQDKILGAIETLVKSLQSEPTQADFALCGPKK